MSDTQEMVNRLLGETKMTLAEGGTLVGTEAEPTHVATMNRFVHRGARAADGRRVKLEAFRVGAKWVTTREAVARFVAALTSRPDATPAPTTRPAGERRRAADRAAAELEKLGA